MKMILSAALSLAAYAAEAASIPMYDLPLKSGPAGSVYKMSEHPNSVFVFEAFQLSCVYCNRNAVNVNNLADAFADNERVQILDLGLDTSDDAYARWIAQHAPNHPVVQDVGAKIYRALRTTNSIPQVFIVNCRGELTASHVGEWSAGIVGQVKAEINQALATVCE